MEKYLIGLVIYLTTSVSWINACAPDIADDVFIGRVEQIVYLDQNQSVDLSELKFSQYKFIFRPYTSIFKYSKPKKWESSLNANSSFKHINKNDLLIGLAYAPDGKERTIYTVKAIAKLSCKNNQLNISETIQPFLTWDRKLGRCKYSSKNILGGFLMNDHKHYEQKLKAIYPTCEKLEKAFPFKMK